MKKNNNLSNNNNNRYRSNNNNNNSNNNSGAIYSLNYKFDSSSIAGKCCGTALDLIKRYNDLAKEALSNSDYVNAEIFRQYAEHYRKIVTDINERRNQRAEQEANSRDQEVNNREQTEAPVQPQPVPEKITYSQPVAQENVQEESKPRVRKAFKIIEISQMKNKNAVESSPVVENVSANDVLSEDKPKRQYRRKTVG